ncbi:hypothetical protein [Anabaena catenula]|uniref:Tail assembly chaperone n=1 Tax=Anabaena catenula FACHB-362 TaxID=2692877 RepID=A0ABR8J7T7_9NOST|nr:hypothetical protein [Anabaena catenula]MBD2694433.1 hypothetical protein [Anabaena catenula FACHB-362]
MAANTNIDKELKTLVPNEVVETSAGDVIVKPFKFTQFPRVLQILTEYSNAFLKKPKEEAQDQTIEKPEEEEPDVMRIALDLAAYNPEGVFELVKLSTGLNQEQLDILEGEEGFDILFKVVEVNLSFFVQKLTPKVLEVAASLTSVADGVSKLAN